MSWGIVLRAGFCLCLFIFQCLTATATCASMKQSSRAICLHDGCSCRHETCCNNWFCKDHWQSRTRFPSLILLRFPLAAFMHSKLPTSAKPVASTTPIASTSLVTAPTVPARTVSRVERSQVRNLSQHTGANIMLCKENCCRYATYRNRMLRI